MATSVSSEGREQSTHKGQTVKQLAHYGVEGFQAGHRGPPTQGHCGHPTHTRALRAPNTSKEGLKSSAAKEAKGPQNSALIYKAITFKAFIL